MMYKSRKIFPLKWASVKTKINFGFCHNRLSYSPLEARAFLASKIIQQITFPKKMIHDEKPLHEKVIQVIEQAPHEFESEKLYFNKMFTTGIEIDIKIFNQERIKRGMQKTSDNKDIFAFYPTRAVTSRIFYEIYTGARVNTLMEGHVGVGKTVSVMLFWILSNMIAEYKFKTFGQRQSEIGKQIINSPKVVYHNLSVNPQLQKDWIRKSILKQCAPQIKDKQMDQFLNFEPNSDFDLRRKLRQHYMERDVEIIMFLDQFNIIIQKLQNYTPGQDDFYQRQCFRFREYFRALSCDFRALYYLSHQRFSSYILNNKHKLGSDLGNQPVSWRPIFYQENSFHEDSITEIVDVFLFLLHKHCPIKHFTQKQKINSTVIPKKYKQLAWALPPQFTLRELIKKYLSSYLLQIGGHMQTYYSIQKSLRALELSKLKELQKLQQFDELIDEVKKILQIIMKTSQQQLSEQFGVFVNSFYRSDKLDLTERYTFLFALFHSAATFRLQSNQKIEYPVHLQPFQYKIDHPKFYKSISQDLFTSDMNSLTILVPPKPLMNSLLPWMHSTVLHLLQNKPDKMRMLFSSPVFADYGLNVLLRTFCDDRPKIILVLDKKTRSFMNFQILNNQPLFLQPIPQNNLSNFKNWSFLSSIQNFIVQKIKEMKQHNLKQMEPTTQRDYFFTTNPKHKLADARIFNPLNVRQSIHISQTIAFAILSIEVGSELTIPKINISVFDVTIEQQRTVRKTKTFIDAFLNFKQKNSDFISFKEQKVQVNLNFFVICLDDSDENWLKQIQDSYSSELNFKSMKDKTTIQIKNFKNGSPSFLKNIGCMTIGEKFLIRSNNQFSIKKSNSPLKEWRLIENIVKKKMQF